MAFDWVGPDLVFGGMTTFFIITGILSLRDAAAGVQTLACWQTAVHTAVGWLLFHGTHTSVIPSCLQPIWGLLVLQHVWTRWRVCYAQRYATILKFDSCNPCCCPAGFSNTGVLTVMMLYLVAEGVTQTGGLDLAMNLMLGKASTTFWAQVGGLVCWDP